MPAKHPRTTVRFGLFELDPEARELYRGGIRIRLAKQPFDLLSALIECPGQVISREALQQHRPTTHGPQQRPLERGVEVDEVQLGLAPLGKQHLARARDPHIAMAENPLHAMDVDFAQGYLLHEPAPIGELIEPVAEMSASS